MEYVVPAILFGPAFLLWVAVMLKASWNVIKHNNIWGD